MTTLVDDNQILESYVKVGDPYVKAITTTNSDISITQVGGVLTVDYSIPPPPALFTATMIAGEESSAIMSGFTIGGYSVVESFGSLVPYMFSYNGHTYTIVGMYTIFGGPPFIAKTMFLEIIGGSGAPAFTSSDFTTMSLDAKVYTSAGLSSESSVLEGSMYRSTFSWYDGDGEYDNTTDFLVNAGNYDVVID